MAKIEFEVELNVPDDLAVKLIKDLYLKHLDKREDKHAEALGNNG